jgi:hypothetical protein
VWNDNKTEDMLEVNKFGIHTLAAPLIDRLTERADGV